MLCFDLDKPVPYFGQHANSLFLARFVALPANPTPASPLREDTINYMQLRDCVQKELSCNINKELENTWAVGYATGLLFLGAMHTG